MKNHLIFTLLFLATFFSCFLPFNEITTVGGSYPSLFGSGTAIASVRAESGIVHKVPLFSLVFMLIAYLLLNLNHKAWKIIGLVVVVLFMLFQFFLYFVSVFTFNLFGPKTISSPSIGFYLLVLFALSFSTFYVVHFIKMIKEKSVQKNYLETDLLDTE